MRVDSWRTVLFVVQPKKIFIERVADRIEVRLVYKVILIFDFGKRLLID